MIMAKELAIRPQKCIGCSTCALTCSLVHRGVFDPGQSNIRIYRDDFAGTFELRFSSTCTRCGQCARICPSGALQLLEIPGDDAPAAEGQVSAQ
jgi:ferredoxin